MIFNVLTGKALSNNSMKSGERTAAERQSSDEHDRLLDIRTLPGYEQVISMPNGPQKMMAIAALNAEAKLREREYAKYWNDQIPRRSISQSSSWVGDVDYDPYSQLMTVSVDGKTYSYPNKSPDEVADLLNSSSLGKYLNERSR